MKITLLSFVFIAVVVGFSLRLTITDNKNELSAAIQPTVTQKNALKVSKNVGINTTNLSLPIELIASTQDTKLTQASPSDTPDAVNSSSEQLDPENFVIDFVETGKPEAIMEYYAELRRARGELIETQMSEEHNDPEWSMELTQSFEAAADIVPMISGLNLAETDCRETICSLHFGFDADTSYKEMKPAMSNIGIVLGTEVWVHHDAEQEGPIVYVARADTVLPDLEQTTNQ